MYVSRTTLTRKMRRIELARTLSIDALLMRRLIASGDQHSDPPLMETVQCGMWGAFCRSPIFPRL
jgi:hypothetical protein